MNVLIKHAAALIACLLMTFTGKSQKPTPPNEKQLREMFIEAQQSRAKDTVIMLQQHRIDTLRLAIREYRVKDSLNLMYSRRIDSIRQVQNKMLLDDNADLRRSLRWQKTKSDVLGGGLLAAVVYLGAKMFFK